MFVSANSHDSPKPVTSATMHTSRLLGFRHVALITVNDTDPAVAAAAAKQDGNGHLGMFLRVNGAAVYARGGNKIPMDLLEGRLSAEAHRRIVHTAAEGNMNMLRVWGGGIWEPRAFFDACDEFGVLVYLDMQFTWGSAEVPGGASDTVRRELHYQLHRVAHHPSIVLLDGCNECGGRGKYESFVMPIVASIDQSRPIWPSSPADGWASGVDRCCVTVARMVCPPSVHDRLMHCTALSGSLPGPTPRRL
jgi:beta-mannosidase